MTVRRIVLTLAGCAAVLVALVTPAAGDTLANRFSANIAPSAEQPLSSDSYVVQITNRPQSDATANNAHVAVPAGFVVDPISLAATTSDAGGCAAASWTVALNLVTSTIDALAPDAGDLCPGGRLTITFGAIAPAVEGTYTWTTTLLQDANDFGQQGSQPAVTVDGTPPPAPTLTATPADPSDDASPSFAFSDDDPTATFLCQLDGGAASACASPQMYSGLGEGTHTFNVTAVDPAGNQSSVTSYSWTIDLTPPSAPTITLAPPAVTGSTSATFSFTDGDASASFQCSLDGAGFSSCASPQTYPDLAEGAHTFGVKAVDPAGNESSVSSYAWTIDLTNPVVTIDPASEPPDPTNQTSASFVFTSNKAGSTFECRLDGSNFSSCSSPATYAGLANGRHSFGVRATDSLGHVGLPSTYEWTIDTIPPTATITSSPAAISNSPSATFAFTGNEAVSSFACSLDGSSFEACTSPKLYVGLPDGSHVFRVRATDLAGNTQPAPASYTWQIATLVPPDTTPPGPVSRLRRIVGYRLLKLTWSLPTDPDFAYVRVKLSKSRKGPAEAFVYQGKRTSYTSARFVNGVYSRYEIQAFDASGNASSPVQVVVPPSVLLRSPRDGQIVKAPPLLLWAGVPRATYYNVQVYRGAQKVLSAWPVKGKLRMRSSWTYNGHRFRLRKGGYRWWVWPGFGARSNAAYGQLLGTGTFIVK